MKVHIFSYGGVDHILIALFFLHSYAYVAQHANCEIVIEGSDDEIEIISPKQNSTPTARKPVSSTPTRERTPSPPASK